jgi:hypothetical protein
MSVIRPFQQPLTSINYRDPSVQIRAGLRYRSGVYVNVRVLASRLSALPSANLHLTIDNDTAFGKVLAEMTSNVVWNVLLFFRPPIRAVRVPQIADCWRFAVQFGLKALYRLHKLRIIGRQQFPKFIAPSTVRNGNSGS